MPDTHKQPVTVGDLVKPCPHERWEGHFFVDCPHKDGAHLTVNSFDLCNENNQKYCSSRPATVADLVSALRVEGVLVVEKVDGEWPEWATNNPWVSPQILDRLAEAQPFPPAGG